MKLLSFIPIFILAACGSSGGGPSSPQTPAPASLEMLIDAPLIVHYTPGPDPHYRVDITLTNVGGSNSSAGSIEVIESGRLVGGVYAPTLAPRETVVVYFQLWNAQGISTVKTFEFVFQGVRQSVEIQFAARVGG